MKSLSIALNDTVHLVDTGSERYYMDRAGMKYISVTQLLKNHFPKPHLDEWRERIGEEEAELISGVARTRGKIIHKAIEEYLEYYDIVPMNLLKMPFNYDIFMQFKRRIDASLTEVNGIELPLLSRVYQIAGTADLIGKWNDIESIIDHKTSKYEKEICDIEDYFVQETIYSIMLEEQSGLSYKQLVCLMGIDHGNEAQVHIQMREQYEKKALEILRAPR